MERYPISDTLSLKRSGTFTVDTMPMTTSLYETADIFLQVNSFISFTYTFISKPAEISQTPAKTVPYLRQGNDRYLISFYPLPIKTY